MKRIIGIKFSHYGQIYFFYCEDPFVDRGDRVLAETGQGLGIATVMNIVDRLPEDLPPDGVRDVLRKVTDEDQIVAEENDTLTYSAHKFCESRIRERQLDMKLVDVEVLFDRSKLVFYFTAPTRIDFRELVKDLVREYHTRIELRQIGVRHETQMLGAVGSCGMVCCCRRFLRKFAVLREEMQVDPDSFDYAFYTYGLSLYGNMPLLEPLESKEVYRIEDFAIVIDTSMSCSGELVARFLEETYDVLSESGSYFKKVHLHIIQCDDAVQSDVLVTSQEELKAYMDDFQIRGSGGTDFRPAFEYVNGLKKSRQAASLKGLIYFTDGKGIYPVQAPSYDTAFVFIENMFSDESVPPWAMKVVLEEEQIMEYRPAKRNGHGQ